MRRQHLHSGRGFRVGFTGGRAQAAERVAAMLLPIRRRERHQVRHTGRTHPGTPDFHSPPAFRADGNPRPPGRG